MIAQIFRELEGRICFSNSYFWDEFDADTMNYILSFSRNLKVKTFSAWPYASAVEAVRRLPKMKTLIAEFVTSNEVNLAEIQEVADLLGEKVSGLFAYGHVIGGETFTVNLIFEEAAE